jgi:hypothetical protein
MRCGRWDSGGSFGNGGPFSGFVTGGYQLLQGVQCLAQANIPYASFVRVPLIQLQGGLGGFSPHEILELEEKDIVCWK